MSSVGGVSSVSSAFFSFLSNVFHFGSSISIWAYLSDHSEYVFSGNSTDLTDYSKQAQIVNLTNDFVNKVAYDAILEANEFEKLFGIALDDKDRYATTDLHFDSAIGNVDYYVAIKDNFVRYKFEGLCKKTDFM